MRYGGGGWGEMGRRVGEMRLTRGLCWTCWATLG